MSERVCVKESCVEPALVEDEQWEACQAWHGVSAAAARANLYAGQEIKQELIVGPEVFQLPDFAFNLRATLQGIQTTIIREPTPIVQDQVTIKLEPATTTSESAAITEKPSPCDQEANYNGEPRENFWIKSCPIKLECTLADNEFLTTITHNEPYHLQSSQNGISWSAEPKIEIKLEPISAETELATIKEKPSHCDEEAYHKGGCYSNRSPVEKSVIKSHSAKLECTLADDEFFTTTTSNKPCRLKSGPNNIPCLAETRTGIGMTKSNITHINLKTNSCHTYKKQFKYKMGADVHKRIHTGQTEQNTSETYKKQFSHDSNIMAHASQYSCEKFYQCDICEKCFTKRNYIVQHLRIHTGEKPFSCKICEKLFSHRAALNLHQRIHTGEKPYTCEICKKQFSDPSAFKQHGRTHTGEKPFSCEICKKQFSHSSDLVVHKRRHTGEKPYTCVICKKQFACPSAFKRHVRIHTDEKPFTCKTCKKPFKRMTHLKRHELIHTGDNRYTCEICKKQIAESSNLKRHMLSHTGEKHYSCEICKKQFSRAWNLKQHTRRHETDRAHVHCVQ